MLALRANEPGSTPRAGLFHGKSQEANMGKFRWTRGDFGSSADRQMMTTKTKSSGTYTSSASAGTVTGLSLKPGEIVKMVSDVDSWVDFGGRTASTSSGHPLSAGIPEWFRVDDADAGAVSVIDVA